MHKTLLLLSFFSCLNIISAQEVSVVSNPSLFEESGLNMEMSLELTNYTFMKNEGSEETEYAWIKTVESAPIEWEFAVFDANLSYFPLMFTSPNRIILESEEEGVLGMHLFPNGVVDCGTVRIDIALWSDTGEHEVIYSAYYEFKVNNPGECLSSVNETALAKVNVYPNPTSDFFTINTDSPFTKIRIIDTKGRLVKVFSRNDLYDISELGEALYFVEIFNDYEKIAVEKIIRY